MHKPIAILMATTAVVLWGGAAASVTFGSRQAAPAGATLWLAHNVSSTQRFGHPAKRGHAPQSGDPIALTIKGNKTKYVNCGGAPVVCTPTQENATLAVSQLENYLASSSVTVDAHALSGDIVIDGSFGWASANALKLDANESIVVNKGVKVNGSGVSFTLCTNDSDGSCSNGGTSGGMLSFGASAYVDFASIDNTLAINGVNFTLVDSTSQDKGVLASLATQVGDNKYGDYALGANYNAQHDNKGNPYQQDPVSTTVCGTIEGLGHSISNLAISDSTDGSVGLFFSVGAGCNAGAIRDMTLVNANVSATAANNAGTLAGWLGNASAASACMRRARFQRAAPAALISVGCSAKA